MMRSIERQRGFGKGKLALGLSFREGLRADCRISVRKKKIVAQFWARAQASFTCQIHDMNIGCQ
jgi:hypothetical protein